MDIRVPVKDSTGRTFWTAVSVIITPRKLYTALFNQHPEVPNNANVKFILRGRALAQDGDEDITGEVLDSPVIHLWVRGGLGGLDTGGLKRRSKSAKRARSKSGRRGKRNKRSKSKTR